MSLTDDWVMEHYDDLVRDFGGYWTIIKDNEVVFSDKRFDVVYERAKKISKTFGDCVIRRIDSGEAVLYGTEIFNAYNHTQRITGSKAKRNQSQTRNRENFC